ncbi:GLPGLI family protein [Tenacibaculum sp. HL-MS23]|uniref:GLPGLI family protein n=1 Tax=Tenacibaculum TaxID=104267 RepID=UPI0023AEC204|nr:MULTISPECIES: GLPGLI family protein [Tenacibaculum]WNW01035.1 GLPGLI family protein [Tenacibaculum sp. HL-MS23]
MKKHLLLFLCIVFTTILSAQSGLQGKVFYTVSLKAYNEQYVDSIFKKEKTTKFAEQYLIKMFKNTKDVTSVLRFSKNESLYDVESKLKNEANKNFNMTATIAGGNTIYYTNSGKKDYYKQFNREEPLRVDILPIKWAITQETKKIGDYLCFKAVAVKKVRDNKPLIKIAAWFTPTIPVSFGPIDYFGLPGLILEVSYNRINIKATKIVLNPKEKIVIKKPTKGKRMTNAAYVEMSKNFFKI